MIAARSREPTIGTQRLAGVTSQGGATAWATDEEFAGYGQGSGSLLDVVATAPLLWATHLVDLAQSGQLTSAQRWLYPILVEVVALANPQIKADKLLTRTGCRSMRHVGLVCGR